MEQLEAPDNLGTPALDVFGQPDDSPPVVHKRTRSGRAYLSILKQTSHVCPHDLENNKPNLVFCANASGNQAKSGMECPTFNLSFNDSPVPPVPSDSLLLPEQADNVIPNIVEQEDSLEQDLKPKKVKFSSDRNVRLFSDQRGTSSDFPQVCSKIESEMKKLKPVVYLMSTVCGSVLSNTSFITNG